MTTPPTAKRLREGSVLGIGASVGCAVLVGYLCTFFNVPAVVQGTVTAGAAGLPAAIEYSLQSRRRDTTEDAARIAQGELRRPIGLVVAILTVALFLTIGISYFLLTVTDYSSFWLILVGWVASGGLLSFVLASYASHYFGKHPYRWTAVALGVAIVLWESLFIRSRYEDFTNPPLPDSEWLIVFGIEPPSHTRIVSYLIVAVCVLIGAGLGGVWYGRRHHAEFLAKKLARMQRAASRASASSATSPQQPSASRTTASTVSASNSPRRMPVRASSSTINRDNGSGSARVARSSLAAAASSRNRGSGLSMIGRSPGNISGRRGGFG